MRHTFMRGEGISIHHPRGLPGCEKMRDKGVTFSDFCVNFEMKHIFGLVCGIYTEGIFVKLHAKPFLSRLISRVLNSIEGPLFKLFLLTNVGCFISFSLVMKLRRADKSSFYKCSYLFNLSKCRLVLKGSHPVLRLFS